MSDLDPRVGIIVDAAKIVAATLILMRDSSADHWSPSELVALHLAAAFESSKAESSTMSLEQYVELVRAHADTVTRLPQVETEGLS